MTKSDSELLEVLIEKTDVIMDSVTKLYAIVVNQATQITEIEKQIYEITKALAKQSK